MVLEQTIFWLNATDTWLPPGIFVDWQHRWWGWWQHWPSWWRRTQRASWSGSSTYLLSWQSLKACRSGWRRQRYPPTSTWTTEQSTIKNVNFSTFKSLPFPFALYSHSLYCHHLHGYVSAKLLYANNSMIYFRMIPLDRKLYQMQREQSMEFQNR